MRGLLREPLVHFLLGGAAIFLLHGWMADPGAGPQDRILVSEDRVSMLVRSFERTWMRAPTGPELQGLIDDYVTEEVLYREALALGLDRDDLVVRRRMRQKMEFLNEGLTESDPTEEDLHAFLAAHPERSRIPSRVSFTQVFLNPAADDARAADLLALLRAGEDPSSVGDATLLPQGLSGATPSQVAGTFGTAFAEALAEASPGTWSGPIASSFGRHLVRVDAYEPGRLPRLEEVRDAVEREWAGERRREARERFTDELRQRYDVEVHMPPDADG
jgi:hypothetical protein